MIDKDLEVVCRLLPPREQGYSAWTSIKAMITRRNLDGNAALEHLFRDSATLCRGWIVRTDTVLFFDGTGWRGRDAEVSAQAPWHRLLHAELAFSDDRGVRLSLIRDRQWDVQEVIEGHGEPCLTTQVVHHAAWGRTNLLLSYRVYWALHPTMPGTSEPLCYQPVACRWAETTTLGSDGEIRC